MARDESGLVRNTVADSAAILTGILKSDVKNLAVSTGTMLQGVRTKRFGEAFKNELKKYYDQGRIKDDYLTTDQGLSNLQLLIDVIEEGKSDDLRFKAMQALFIGAATEEVSTRDEHLIVELMRLVRDLDSADILILATTYRLKTDPSLNATFRPGSITSAQQWLELLAKHSGLASPELVEIHERKLMSKFLLSGRVYSDESGVINKDLRLNSLSLKLCEFLAKYSTEDSQLLL